MVKKSFLLLGAILLSACSGGGSDNTTENPVNDLEAGIYFGTLTPDGKAAENAVGIITSTGKAAIVDIDTLEIFIGTQSAKTIVGSLYATTTVDSTAVVDTIQNTTISGTYTSELGGGGFNLTGDADLYARSSSLSKLVGTWIDDVYTNIAGTSTWVIQTDGMFEVSTTQGCAGTGSFSLIDEAVNEYAVTMSISNCAELNGTHTGFAVLSDSYNPDDTLSVVFSNAAIAGFSNPVKQ